MKGALERQLGVMEVQVFRFTYLTPRGAMNF
jgi:hypothetical protein